MTVEELELLFDKHRAEYLEENRDPTIYYPTDLCAFNLLARLVKSNSDIIAGASHDVIWLEPSREELAAVATEADILKLIRCGVRLDGDCGFEMYA